MLKVVTNPGASTDHIDLDKCILCQNSKKEYLSQGDKVKEKLLEAAKVIPDDQRSKQILSAENEAFEYHATSCYATFIKASKRSSGKSTLHQSSSEMSDSVKSPENTRVKRQKVDTKKICVVCGYDRLWDKNTQTRVHDLFRVCEAHPAQKLLNAAELKQGDVLTRIVYCYDRGVKDIYAADIHYHNKCLQKYFRERIDSIMVNLDKEDSTKKDVVSKVFFDVTS